MSGPGEPATFVGTDKQFNLGSQPLMKVGRDGKRFANESTPYDFCASPRQPTRAGVFCKCSTRT